MNVNKNTVRLQKAYFVDELLQKLNGFMETVKGFYARLMKDSVG